MNGLALRISKGGGKKLKFSHGFPALQITSSLGDILVSKNPLFKQFLESSTADEQLSVLKNILQAVEDDGIHDTAEFLAFVYFYAELKHPVKCFVARHITKCPKLSPLFSVFLATQIESNLQTTVLPNSYNQFANVVASVAACIESFPAGSEAVRLVEIVLAQYLKKCLSYCVATLSETNLSPTEKNVIFSLTHTTLRLFLHIIQKCDPRHTNDLIPLFVDLRECVKRLLYDSDVPMDTKSVCGILFLGMRCMENGVNAWTDILNPNPSDDDLQSFLSTDESQLSLYSAIATTVAMDRLQPFVVTLCEYILDIAERNSSESTFVLGATRTVFQISKHLARITDTATGLALIDLLLRFIWGHLDHHMDSVRHLTAQLLGNVVKYCAGLRNEGNESALNSLYSALTSLDRSNKSYYVGVTALVIELGAKDVMDKMPSVIQDVIQALDLQAVQASATTTLETLLEKHIRQSDTSTIYLTWIEPILRYATARTLDCSVLNILEGLLVKAVFIDRDVMGYILTHIKSPKSQSQCNLKCTLMLLSVARKSGALDGPGTDTDWKNVIGYDVLKMAAWDAVDETRILSLSLIVESPKSTEPFTRGELDFVLHYLKYNVNAQSPNFRQITLSLFKKFLKRLEDSYKVLKRQNSTLDYILDFITRLRELCFGSLRNGANLGRRQVALQVLDWCDKLQLEGYQRIWTDDYVRRLLYHLEDSYEKNKALALSLLLRCPTDLLKPYCCTGDLDVDGLIKQASSLKPTECVSAAYKLDLLRIKFPERIHTLELHDKPEPVLYSLLNSLLVELTRQVEVCKQSIIEGAVNAPMYGIIHCLGHLITKVDTQSISTSSPWSSLISSLMVLCYSACSAAGLVVNNSSPEGHLPSDLHSVSDTGNTHGVTLADGRLVTAQMVLLCAWRTVKEVSLLLGDLSSLLTISGEDSSGNLTTDQIIIMGAFFTRLLAETKHRGAFEQAYVGFTKLLARLWRSTSPALHSLPRQWLTELMTTIANPQNNPGLSSTRRSAGLPFMIQALVTTELQVQDNPKCFHECMATLLRLARTPQHSHLASHSNTSVEQDKDSHLTHSYGTEVSKAERTDTFDPKHAQSLENQEKYIHLTHSYGTDDVKTKTDDSDVLEQNLEKQEKYIRPACSSEMVNVETRTHAINILRALFRNTNLDEVVSSYVGEGLMTALQGFEGSTWMERNSSTLLFSALMVRIFGVQRNKDGDNLCVRNRMTGRIFFLRYPKLYDFMLHKLEEVSSSANGQILRPSLYPILLLLARLYPSSLEGTVSNLKLVCMVPYVGICGGSSVLQTRQLAAKAIVALVSPQRYVPHLEEMFTLLCDTKIKRNYCHGILLQLIKLLESKPDNLSIARESHDDLAELIQNTQWILNQAIGSNPCYLLVDEYVKLINLIFMKLPSLIQEEFATAIMECLKNLLFKDNLISTNTCGREICLSNCLYLYFIILNKNNLYQEICDLVEKSLKHSLYEVVLSALNYLMILYGNLELDNTFHKHLNIFTEDDVLKMLRSNVRYLESLRFVLKNNKYAECIQKTLKIINSEENTEKYIVEIKVNKPEEIEDEVILKTLLACIENEHENVSHIYLETLSNFVTKRLEESHINGKQLLEVIRTMFDCSFSSNKDETREMVAKFLELNYDILLKNDLKELSGEEKFEFKATLFSAVAILLEDDDSNLRQRVSDIITRSLTTHNLNDVTTENVGVMTKTIDETKKLSNESSQNVDAKVGSNDGKSNYKEKAINSNESKDFVGPNKMAEENKIVEENKMATAINKMATAENKMVFVKTPSIGQRVISMRAAELLRESLKEDTRVLMILALLDFGAEVCISDEVDNKARVFDTSEKYNTYLEELIWKDACSDILGVSTSEIMKIATETIHSGILKKLCEEDCFGAC